MDYNSLIKLQGLLVDEICRLAGLMANLTQENLPNEYQRNGRYLYRSIANRRLQLECVNDLLQGRELRHQMPIDWRGKVMNEIKILRTTGKA